MLIVQNNVKKGIEIPDINYELINDNQVKFFAIDKVKYADFLSLGIQVYVRELGEFEIRTYVGDEITVPEDPQSNVHFAKNVGVIIFEGDV